MRTIVILLSITILLPLFPTATFACGGYEPLEIESAIKLFDLVVAARVDFVDALGANAVLKVERYFKGSGGNHLAVVETRPANFFADTLRDYSNGCYSLGPYYKKLHRDEEGYFALRANGDGTYHYYGETVWIPGSVFSYRQLDSTEGLVDFYLFSDDVYDIEAPAPAEEFEQLLLHLSGTQETTVPQTGPYPIGRFLNIRTESGERYRLNPDRSVTHIDLEISPEAISNDGSHVMFRLDNDELGFQYMDRVKKPFHYCAYNLCLGSATVGGGALSTVDYSTDGYLTPIEGSLAKFSPDSNFVAVQERERMVIYMFDNWTEEKYGYGRHMGMKIAAEQSTWEGNEVGDLPMLWSPDSTTLVYQDNAGIWHWDIFEETHPRLVLLTKNDERLLDVSRSGRFVRYSVGDSWFLIDVKHEAFHERVIPTPDERNVILIRSSYPDDTPTVSLGRDRWDDGWRRKCVAPLSQCTVNFIYDEHLIEYFEYRPGWIGLVSPQSISLFPWYLSTENTSFETYVSYEKPIVAFDYDNMYGRPAVAVGDYALDLGYIPDFSINANSEDRSDFVDLSGRLDSPIVDLEWGQPVFLDR